MDELLKKVAIKSLIFSIICMMCLFSCDSSMDKKKNRKIKYVQDGNELSVYDEDNIMQFSLKCMDSVQYLEYFFYSDENKLLKKSYYHSKINRSCNEYLDILNDASTENIDHYFSLDSTEKYDNESIIYKEKFNLEVKTIDVYHFYENGGLKGYFYTTLDTNYLTKIAFDKEGHIIDEERIVSIGIRDDTIRLGDTLKVRISLEGDVSFYDSLKMFFLNKNIITELKEQYDFFGVRYDEESNSYLELYDNGTEKLEGNTVREELVIMSTNIGVFHVDFLPKEVGSYIIAGTIVVSRRNKEFFYDVTIPFRVISPN